MLLQLHRPWPRVAWACLALAHLNGGDFTDTIDERGIGLTPTDETLTDAVKWLRETGHITNRPAGRPTT